MRQKTKTKWAIINVLGLFAALFASALAVAQEAATLEPPKQETAKEAVDNLKAQVGEEPSSESEQAEDAKPEYENLDPAALKRITYDIKYMSSDEMGGRQPGTPGIKLCEDFIVAEYKKAGLKTLENGTYFQEMEVGNTRTVDKEVTSLVLSGPDGKKTELDLGENYQQLICRSNFDLSSDLVFVGYGISADKHNYDDFAGIDVEGKIVVMIRSEPQAEDENSVFNGAEPTRHASGRQKVTSARRAKAAGILLVNDAANSDGGMTDDLVQADRFRTNSLPIAQVKRSVIDQLLKTSPLLSPTGEKIDSLETIEQQIDSNLEPISQSIEGWSAEFKSSFKRKTTKTNNIIGIIEGEGPNADETIVIGAHYDHLGMGAYGSRAGGRKEIHNGADDNATGTAAVIELARRFGESDKKPGRRLVFICFTAEEMGLLGARHYVENPLFPLEKTVMMMNFDMIGWLRDNTLTLYNGNSSADLVSVYDQANETFEFELNKTRGGGSDQIPFNQRSIPNVFIHTGQTAVYHTPEDDFETIDCEGALKVINYSEIVLDEIASLEKRPTFGAPKAPARFRLGVILVDENETVTIDNVSEGSVAESAGLQAGDVILEVNDKAITKRRQMTLAIQKNTGKTIKMKLKRGAAEVVLNVELKKKD